ncbi:MAG: STAS domain-containing protein [Verrucomicrobiota bacterium]
MDPFSHHLKDQGKALIVKIDLTKFDVGVSKEFQQYMDIVWDDSMKSITLDVSSVTFIDSSGVGALLSVHKLAGDSCQIILSGVKPPVREVIELLRLQRVFTLQSPNA